MKNSTIYILSLVLTVLAWCPAATGQAGQGTRQLGGVVLDGATRMPIPNAQVSSPDGVRAVISGPSGEFMIGVGNVYGELTVVRAGYHTAKVPIMERDSIVVYMQLAEITDRTETNVIAFGTSSTNRNYGSASTVGKKDIGDGYLMTSDALTGRFAGLRVTNKSGMPGEGSFVNLHGTRSLLGQNTPLIVVDGVPYLSDQKLSQLINGYSFDILGPVNIKEIEQITLLQGTDALPYGSLGSNGVLMIETEKGLDNQIQVEVQSVNGISFINKTLPMLGTLDFKKYISDIGSTRYEDSRDLEVYFPFLKESMTDVEKVRYGFNTDWQKVIYTPAFSSDNMLKVKGGDAVIRFLLTAGYQRETGIEKGTSQDKFYTRGNTNINFSRKLTAHASVAFDYTDLSVMEQGMVNQTNPMLAAYSYSPLSGKYEVDDNGMVIMNYTPVDAAMGASNPAAMKTEIDARNKMFDMIINTGVQYKLNNDLQFNVGFGLFYKYIKEDLFVGGRTSGAIAPLMDGLAENTVRGGSKETKNYYGQVSGTYGRVFAQRHHLRATAGWQIMTANYDASYGAGINTTSDRYRNLTNVSGVARTSGGYSEVFNWMNAFVSAEYSYNHQLFLTAVGTMDAASTYGKYSDRYYVFPGVKAGWKIDNAPFLRNTRVLSNLMLRAEYSINANSRYDKRYSSYYYVLQMLRDVSGLVRAGVPNLKIGPEKVHYTSVGVDFATLGDKFAVSLDVYQEHTRDMIIGSNASPVYGVNSIFRNSGSIRTRGAELGFSALVFNRHDFRWRAGFNVARYKSQVRSLGGVDQQLIDLGDGITLINKVGETPFSFYGHSSEGVFASSAEAAAAGLTAVSGYAFSGGDIRFTDMNDDGVISSADRRIIGSPDPDLFGGVHSLMSYKGFSLFVNFSFSYGNDIYNGVRRFNESGNTFTNQAASMGRRWVAEGQATDIPRVAFGDPAGNNRFSSRWIEDGSYIKMKELTLSYDFNRPLLFMTGFKVFVSGMNLWTFTNYTGSDPELSYSYDLELQGMDLGKVPVPRMVKLGLIMNF